MPRKLTDSLIWEARLNPRPGVELLEAAEPGLFIRLGAHPVWILDWEIDGAVKVIELGSYPEIDMATATTLARRLKAGRARPGPLAPTNVAKLLRRYERDVLSKKSRGRDTAASLNRVLAQFAEHQLAEVTSSEIKGGGQRHRRRRPDRRQSHPGVSQGLLRLGH